MEPEPEAESTTPEPEPRFQVGETADYEGGGSIALLKVNNPVEGQLGDTPRPGRKFVSLLIKQCALPEGNMSTFVSEWVFTDRRGGEYTSALTMHGWPSPEFPQGIDLQSGQCKKGWMALELKKGPKFVGVAYRLAGTGQTVAQWNL